MNNNLLYEFYIDFISRNRKNFNTHILDYGCGLGNFIKYAKSKSIEVIGADNFYGDETIKDVSKIIDNIEIIVIKKDGKLPFDSERFDYITTMQVFEHVEDLGLVLSEINRVLKNGGTLLCDFPLKYSINEPHCNLPCSHWFSKTSSLRKPYCKIMYTLGFGSGRIQNDTFETWYNRSFNFIDNYCHYRSETSFRRIARNAGFKIKAIDADRLIFKLKNSNDMHKILAKLFILVPKTFLSKILRIKASSTFLLEKVR